MLLSKHVSTKIAPCNFAHWKALGYDVGRTGGRAGVNGNKNIKVKVEDLEPGSGVLVECRCNKCEQNFTQKFYRDKELCGKCRQAAGRKKERTLSVDPQMPSREELLKFIESGRGGKTRIAEKYDVSTMVVKGWLKKQKIDFSENLKYKTIPTDFVEYFTKNNPTKTELAQKYRVNLPLIDRWFKRLNLPFKGITTKIEMPDIQEAVELNQTMDSDELAKHYDVSPSKIVVWFRENDIQLKKYSTQGTSDEEKEFVDFLNETVPGFIQNKKNILSNKKMELDAYHPVLKIAFEYDGAFWHSFAKPNEHREKWDCCHQQGISLYRIHSFEWKYKKNLVKSMVRARLGVCNEKPYARNLDVRKIGQNVAQEHHLANHIAGAGNSSVNFGLYNGSQLLSVMSFAKSRYSGGYEWEISRFSSLMNSLIVGGAGKLFGAFRKQYDPQSVLTFADLRWGLGKAYENIGFVKVKRGPPTYWYFHDDFPEERFYRMSFQKKKLLKKLDTFDPNITEVENMRNNRYYQYWDCGSDHFVWKK